MKKTGILLLIALTSLLSGCTFDINQPTDVETPTELPLSCEVGERIEDGKCVTPPLLCEEGSYEENGECIKELVCSDDEYKINGECILKDKMELLDNAPIYNHTEGYEFEVLELGLYEYNKDQGTDYVNIEDFLNLMGDNIISFEVSKSNIKLTLTYTQYTRVTTTITFDHIQNSIAASDYSIYRNMGVDYQEYSDFGVKTIDGNYVAGNNYSEINIDDYDFDMVYDNEQFYIPLVIANLLFSGDYIEVVNHNREIHIFEFLDDYEELIGSEPSSFIDQEKIMEDTTNYLALFYDYFYGLDDYKGLDSSFILSSESINNQEDLATYNNNLREFVYDFEDMHTRIYQVGYLRDQIEEYSFVEGSRWDTFIDALYVDKCSVDDPGSLTEFDEYYVLRLDGFTMETEDILKSILVDIDPTKDIYIDLTCNTGGMLGGVYSLLTYITDQPFDVGIQINETNEQLIYTLISKYDNTLSNDFYVVIDTPSYSAANVFTAIFKDHNLGTVVGHNTGGGACAINFTTLPNNMVMVYSSNMMFLAEKDSDLDAGVTPDIFIDGPLDIATIDEYLKTLEE